MMVLALGMAIGAFVSDDSEFDALSKAATSCNRAVVTRAWSEEVKRHSSFLLESFKEQREIATARADLADRRHKLRTGVPAPAGMAPDTEQGLSLIGDGIADRQAALDDMQKLDHQQQDMVGYFRQLYLSQCQGRTS
jgi:hypothetical protein